MKKTILAIGIMFLVGCGNKIIQNPLITNPPITPITLPANQNIFLTSDKDVYKQGETINVYLNIKSGYEGEFYTYDNGWSIYKFNNNEWMPLKTNFSYNYFCANISECSKINMKNISDCEPMVLCERAAWTEISKNYFKNPSAYKITWDQKYEINQKSYKCNDKELAKKVIDTKCAEFGPISPGLYEIRFSYLDQKPEDVLQYISETKQVSKQIEIK